MTIADAGMTRQKLRAPQEPNTALIEPSIFSVGDVIASNRDTLAAAAAVDVGGMRLEQLSAVARTQLLEAARRFTGRYRTVSAPRSSGPQTLLLSGHQPELFHPGVCFKNVALSEWSREQRAVGIHLIIDSDLCRTPSIRVPTGTPIAPRVVDVGLDAPSLPIPYEEQRIQDTKLFGSFDRRVCAAIKSLIPNPLVTELWSYAREAGRSGVGLGQATAQARHRLEHTWGLETLEIPWSEVCDTNSFRRFILAILFRLSDFQNIYNQALRKYRDLNRIRGGARPVPELTVVNGDWLEAPFWCWTSDQPQRMPLLVRTRKTVMQLRPNDTGATWTLHLDHKLENAIDQLAAARAAGLKIRSRALTTTMYARMVLSDLFLHGIGGAKYDELTDEICRRFWHTSTPEYMVLSATILLPISRSAADLDDLRRLDGMLRDLWYHPENHLDLFDTAAGDRERRLKLVAEKNRWIKSVPAGNEPRVAKRRHEGIVSTTAALRQYVAPLRASLLDEREQVARELRRSTVLSSREYSFCLFPENRLRRTLLDLLH